MKFQTKDEWQTYLLNELNGSGYAVVKYGERTALLYFAKHDYKGEPWLLEAPNSVRQIEIGENSNPKDFEDHGMIVRGRIAYDIDTPQVSPFLPEEIEILDVLGGSEEKALDYLLKK